MFSAKWAARMSKRQINTFVSKMNSYCEQNHLPTNFNSFLNHKEQGDYISKTYIKLFTAPKVLLANSMSFLEYYANLDPDFQSDIISSQEIYDMQMFALHNPYLREYLYKVLKDDCI